MSVSEDLLLIDSKDRTSGSPSSQNFTVALAENVQGTYQFVSFSMTNNLYNIVASENDQVHMNHSVDGDNTVTLTAGHYTSATLIAELETQLETISAVTYTVAYDATNGKITVTPGSGNFGYKFATTTTRTSRYILGKDEVDDTPASSIESDNPIDLRLHDNIVLKISEDNFQHVTLPTGLEASVIVPIDEIPFGDTIHYKLNQGYPQFFKFLTSTSVFTIQLFAGDGDNLPINGTEWRFGLKKLF